MKSRSLSIVATLAIAAVFALKASAVQAAFYDFNVESATATDNETGQWIRLSGAGQFSVTDPNTMSCGSDPDGFVKGHGHYKRFDADGQVLENGSWAATDFECFWDQGKENPGLQNGVLEITVTLFPVGDAPLPGVTLTVNCPPEEGPGEGITVELGGQSFETPGGFALISPQPGR